jgi:CHAD domain-containing protein
VRDLDAEGIHRMRVGLRRLRAAISLLGEILPIASTERVKTELKWLTGELATAREIDVFVTEKIEPLGAGDAPKRGVRAIERQFAARRSEAFERARHALDMPRYRRLSIHILEWLETRRLRSEKIADAPIGKFAEGVMLRRLKKILKGARGLDDLAPQQRHKLRIKIKKVRYAIDFFRSLYRASAQATLDDLSEKLKRGQDTLGALNDFVAHRKMATDAALNAPGKDRRVRAFASGLIIGQECETSKVLLKNASKSIRRLKPSGVWRRTPNDGRIASQRWKTRRP